VSFSLSAAGIAGILLDIEGTTSPIQFVYNVLFPYVRQELSGYFAANTHVPETEEIVRALHLEHADDAKQNPDTPIWQDPPVAYINWLMDQDRKSTALKAIQGKIWQDGYSSGRLKGAVFPDVPPSLKRWSSNSIDIRIFSSGSQLAQRLLFGNTEAGDLTPFLRGYFDTTVGAKQDPESYLKIARAFKLEAEKILFISDITRELDAARRCGMATLLCLRPGNHPQVIRDHRTITSFADVND